MSSSVVSSSHLQCFPALGFFPTSQFFPSGGQIMGASVSTSVFPVCVQDWFPLGLKDLISLLSKALSRVFSNTTVQNHQFFSAQPSLWSLFNLYAEYIMRVHLKEISPGCSLEGLMLKLKLQYFGHLMWRVDSLEKTLMPRKDWGQEEKGTTEDEMVG